ncbi:MAG: ribosome biogenesis GTPase Der, partial [Kiritimatiellae bacterium]|nr:ribosome biogenesis GTPase Der [Kiritimatiellia bacterium]
MLHPTPSPSPSAPSGRDGRSATGQRGPGAAEAPATPPPARRRIVAIVGRPNVGKSAIFNRIARKRIAIVHDESGVTRDRLVRPVEWDGEVFDLVDTGGINLAGADSRDAIQQGTIDQARAALEDAAAAILVVDAQSGLTPVDEEVARLVRKAAVPCVVAVNKCDLPKHEARADDFAPLAMPMFPVSAQHDRGFGGLMAAVLPHLPPAPPEPATAARPLKVAVVGRPNAGKSSLVNRILRQVRLIVSDVAGTTRDSIEVPFTLGEGASARHYRFIDTAGMRNVHKIDSAVERFSHFRAEAAIKEADVVVLAIDAMEGPLVQDKRIAAVIARENKGCVVAVTKWDVAHDNPETEVTETKYAPELRKAMPFLNHCPLVFCSANSGYNVRRLLETIDAVAEGARRQLPTGLLNRVIGDAYAAVKPPSSGRRHFKLFYATQTGNEPLRVRVFVNDAQIPGQNYTAYLVKALRAAFGLEGVPVVLDYYPRARADASAPQARPPERRAPR